MGLFDKTKKQTTKNTINTTTTTTVGEIGLTGNAAVELARVAAGVGNNALDASVINTKLNNELAGKFIDENNLTVREIAGNVENIHGLNVGYLTNAKQQDSQNFNQLISTANNLLDFSNGAAAVTIEGAQEQAKNVLSSAKNISDRLLPQTKELQTVAIGALILTGVIFAYNIYKG